MSPTASPASKQESHASNNNLTAPRLSMASIGDSMKPTADWAFQSGNLIKNSARNTTFHTHDLPGHHHARKNKKTSWLPCLNPSRPFNKSHGDGSLASPSLE